MEYRTHSPSPALKPLLTELMKKNIGIAHEGIRLFEINTGRPSIDYISTTGIGDRFKLKLPYAGKCLTWDVIFNSLSPNYPPDFDLNDDTFASMIDVDYLEQMVPSLLNWDSNDSKALTNVVSELYSLYKKYQIDQLKENCCWYEYLSIVKSGVSSPDDIEVIISGSGTVYFLIKLCPDMSDYLVSKIDPENDYVVYISTNYSALTGGKMSKPQITFSPALDDLLHLRMLPPKHDGLDLAEYLKKVLSKVDEAMPVPIMKPVAKRKRFIFEWLSHFGPKVIEYDALEFRRISFLLEQDGFCCILQIKLFDEFPSVCPEYRVQSIYSADKGMTFKFVPFNPVWPMKAIVGKAIEFIENELPQFRKQPLQI